MGKKEKLYDLQIKIAEKSERVKYLLDNIMYNREDTVGMGTLACIASEENEKIAKSAEKLAKIINN